MRHTIYALSTVYGKSAIAIFRISGKEAARTFDIFKLNQPKPKTPALVKIFDGKTLVDEALSIYFQKPNSFTGEDLVEIQCHGSLAVIKHISDQLSKKFLLAEPGEFTQRAFFNNKLDLTKAEGIIDLINAETKEQIKQTSRQFLGQLKDEYDRLRKSIIKAASYLEAYMDFPDEDITNVDIDKIKSLIDAVSEKISLYLKDNYVGEKIKKGFEVAIIGPPNSGKSTLFNYFARKDYAIVTNIPGTTRDTLELKLDLNGYPVVIADTAGIHTTSDIIEKEGIKKAVKFAQNADITIIMRDIKELDKNDPNRQNINHGTNFIYVASKADNTKQLNQIFNDKNFLPISVHENINLKNLENKIFNILCKHNKESHIITNTRHRKALKNALSHLKKIDLKNVLQLEIAAENLKIASNYIGSITGAIHTDDILDKVFSEFCIGK